MTDTRLTFCSLCESFCGLEVDVENGRIADIRPDREHVVSNGYACVKGTRFDSVQHSPDRITKPMKRMGEEWIPISWGQALDEIAEKMRAIIDANGPQSFGHFVGAPGGANLLSPIFRGEFFKGLGSNRMYGTGSCDTMNKFRVNGDMYGSPMRLAYPDVDHTRFMMILGANPDISGTTLYHLPRSRARLGGIVKRGGRVVFINPRRVESARIGEHFFIRPDTDVYFLAAFCNEIIRRDGLAHSRIERYMKNFDELKRCVAPWTAERQAQVTGISADTLRELVEAFLAADGAALNMATGVNQGRSGTLCYWLLESISAITGNFDRKGGNLIGEGIIDFALQAKDDPILKLGFHRQDDLPSVSGQQPAAMVADDIFGGLVKGMIVEASNPVLAVPNPENRLEQALGELDLLVSIDWFRNETGNLAHYILPAATWMERPGMPYALQSFTGCTPTPYLYAADAVLEPPPQVREEWWMYVRLADKFGITLMGNRILSGFLKLAARLAHTRFRFVNVPKMLIGGMLKQAGQPDFKAMLRDHPHGLRLSDNEGGNFLGTERVLTGDRLVDLAPEPYVQRFEESVEKFFTEEIGNLGKMKLIGKREIKRMNTSSSNSSRLVKEKTNYAYICPRDARRIGVADRQWVKVSSEYDSIFIPVRVTDEMMPGTVAIPQCWGHQKADGLSHAQRHPGVNSNLLAGDGYRNIEKLSGMAHLSGILVEIEKSDRIAASS
ncbi:MAG: molybdopterin-dependent oxidoreductase [Halieaceae bacterium]|nr:molybdopterin-dependent oxidoreductase [Halieaceae bacterium]